MRTLPRLLTLFALVGCGAESKTLDSGDSVEPADTADSGSGTDTGDGDDDVVLTWEACPAELAVDADITCAHPALPLDWDDPTGTAIDVWVMRVPANGTTAGQVWVLDGGPGGSGIGYAQNRDLLGPLSDAGYELLIPMHRGTGLSEPLTCARPNDTAACLADLQSTWGEGLAHFSTTGAARDLLGLMDAEPDVGTQLVWGVSYGTFWGQRALQLRPDLADGIVLDGILSLRADVEVNHIRADPYIRDFLDLCDADPVCSAGTGGDAEEALLAGIEAVASGSCPLPFPLTRADAEDLFASIMGSEVAPLALPLATMFSRCDADDQAAILHLATTAGGSGEEDPLAFNDVLGAHVAMIDIFAPTHTLEEVEALEADILLPGYGAADLFAGAETWADVPREAWDRQVGTVSTPVLMLQGGLDLATVAEWSAWALDDMEAPVETLAFFPYAGHGTPWFTNTADGSNCSYELMLAFAADPSGTVDLACVEDTLPPDLDLSDPTSQAMSEALLGVSDPWRREAVARPPGQPGPVHLSPAARAALSIIR